MALRAVKKITAKEVMGGKVEKTEINVPVLNDDNTPVMDGNNQPIMRKAKVAVERDLFTLMGRAHSHKSGSTNFGDFTAFHGRFEARRLSDGEVFSSTECIFPPIADQLALDAYVRAKAINEDADVDFAFVIGVTPDARGSEGFKFTCKPLVVGAPAEDPLAALRSSLAPNFAQVLGAEVMAKIGLALPGEGAKMIPHNPETGEVIEGEAKPAPSRKKAETAEA